jgi:alpha-glucosidase (family GH31 glycosyl hydrolase)
LGIYSPRFAINCFKTSPDNNSVGDVIEPWMYPETTPLIRNTIKRRYEIIPYLYSLALESHLTASPPQRWIGWGYESDPEVWTPALKAGDEQYWLGDTLLVGGVYQPSVSVSRLYLPKGKQGQPDQGYVNLNAPHQYLSSGQWVDIASQWKSSIPLLAKVGGAIPVGKNRPTRMPGEQNPACVAHVEDDYRGVEIFPPKGSSQGHVYSTTWYEDDGISRNALISKFTVSYSSTDAEVVVGFQKDEKNQFVPPWTELHFILPVGDKRRVVLEAGGSSTARGVDKLGRSVYKIIPSSKLDRVKEKL